MNIEEVSRGVGLTLALPYPPTTNNAYVTPKGRRRRFLTREGKKYKADIATRLEDHPGAQVMRRQFTRKPPHELTVTLDIYPPDLRWRDLANTEKLLVDSVCEWLGVDDRLITRLVLQRRDVDRPDGRVELTMTGHWNV